MARAVGSGGGEVVSLFPKEQGMRLVKGRPKRVPAGGTVPTPASANGNGKAKTTKARPNQVAQPHRFPSPTTQTSTPSPTPLPLSTGQLHFLPSHRPDSLPVDVVDELSEPRRSWCGDGQRSLTLRGVPAIVRISVDRLRARAENTDADPSINTTLAVCIGAGVQDLYSLPAVQELLGLKREVDLLDSTVAAEGLNVVHGFFSACKISIVDLAAAGSARYTVALAEDLRGYVKGMATGLGVGVGEMSTLCAMDTLQFQADVLPEHRRQMAEAVRAFLRQVRLQVRFGKVLVEELKDGD